MPKTLTVWVAVLPDGAEHTLTKRRGFWEWYEGGPPYRYQIDALLAAKRSGAATEVRPNR